MENMKRKSKHTIQLSLLEYFSDCEDFSLHEAEEYIQNELQLDVKNPSIRARIYEGIDKGIFKRLSKGVYTVTKGNNQCLLINGDGRDLSMLEDNSIDCIITDHPYLDIKSHKGGNRNFASYECFQYNEEDFKEKSRVLKDGCFLVEFLPEENANNFEYLYQIKMMAKKVGLEYYTKIAWVKGSFVANTGRKAKNSEDILFFTKGKARNLKADKKKSLKTGLQEFMSGTNGMLPTSFNFQPPKNKERIHQAEKPIDLLESILNYVTVENEVILDQFAGSGNLGVACLNKNRNAILIEKDETVFSKLKENIENHVNIHLAECF